MSAPESSPRSLGEWLRAASAASPALIFARVGEPGEANNGMRLGALDALADRHSARWRETELPRGSRILQIGAPDPRALAATIGATRAGLEVALASPAQDAVATATMADRIGAVAIVGPSEFAGLPMAERIVEAAILCEGVRLIATHGAAVDGALWLDAPPAPEVRIAEAELEPTPTSLAAMEVARELVSAARIEAGAVIVSLAPLGAAGGLIVGAFAPLIARAHMIWQAPFSGRGLVEALEASGPAHLVAPARIAPQLGLAGLLHPSRVASLTLISPSSAPCPEFAHGLDAARVLMLRAGSEETPRLDRATRPKTARWKQAYTGDEIGEPHV